MPPLLVRLGAAFQHVRAAPSHPLLRRLGRWTRRSLRNLVLLLALLATTRLACEAAWWAAFTARRAPPGGPGGVGALVAWGQGHAMAAARGRPVGWAMTTTATGGGGGFGVVSNVRNHTTAYLGRVTPAAVEGWAEYARGYGYWPCCRRYRVTPELEVVPVEERRIVAVAVFDQGTGAWWRDEEEGGQKKCARTKQNVVELDQQWWSWEEIKDPEEAEQAGTIKKIEKRQEKRESREDWERRNREWWEQWELEQKRIREERREREERYEEVWRREEMELQRRQEHRDSDMEKELLRNRREFEMELESLVGKWKGVAGVDMEDEG